MNVVMSISLSYLIGGLELKNKWFPNNFEFKKHITLAYSRSKKKFLELLTLMNFTI